MQGQSAVVLLPTDSYPSSEALALGGARLTFSTGNSCLIAQSRIQLAVFYGHLLCILLSSGKRSHTLSAAGDKNM